MIRLLELRQKEVININDGSRFGYIDDIILDIEQGNIIKLVVPISNKTFNFFGKEQEIQIPWAAIRQIGEDLILVDFNTNKDVKQIEYL